MCFIAFTQNSMVSYERHQRCSIQLITTFCRFGKDTQFLSPVCSLRKYPIDPFSTSINITFLCGLYALHRSKFICKNCTILNARQRIAELSLVFSVSYSAIKSIPVFYPPTLCYCNMQQHSLVILFNISNAMHRGTFLVNKNYVLCRSSSRQRPLMGWARPCIFCKTQYITSSPIVIAHTQKAIKSSIPYYPLKH